MDKVDVDQELIGRYVTDRDEASFATLVERYQSLVFSACLRVLGNRHDAEDAAQAVFLILARKAASIDVNRRLAPWLHRVATDVSRDAWNARRVREHHQRKATTMSRSASDPDLAGELDAALCQLSERE